jgi:hypothetical protein
MKKFITLLFTLLMILCLVACGTSDMEESQPDSESTQTVETTEPIQVEESHGPDNDGSDSTLISVPGEQIYFSAPGGWVVKDENLSRIVANNEDCLVSICYGWPTSDVDLIETITRLGKYFTTDASINSHGFIRNSNIEVTSTEKSAVAGYDCIVFNGVVDNGGNWDCHVYGYTFVVNNVELMVVGLVSTQEQDAQMISDINKLTDQIAASVRTEQ